MLTTNFNSLYNKRKKGQIVTYILAKVKAVICCLPYHSFSPVVWLMRESGGESQLWIYVCGASRVNLGSYSWYFLNSLVNSLRPVDAYMCERLHWFRKKLVTCWVSIHYLNQGLWSLVVTWTPRNTLHIRQAVAWTNMDQDDLPSRF